MAIQQHPLPQDITSYRFRLIGDMTLKQFASLGICIVLAIITYSLPLPFFFKYPLIFLFLLLGVGMAFVPVQGRSLDIWLVAFIKSIYSPTQYTWKKSTDQNQAGETSMPSRGSSTSVSPVSNPQIQITEAPQTSPMPASSSAPVPATPITQPSSPQEVTPNAPAPSVTPSATPAPTSHPISSASAPTINLPIPFTPTTPNTLVGLTLTAPGNILDTVLVEIKKDNLTLRATRSNKLGQFMFARPLESGLYQILAEKEGFTFVPYSLELTGEIVKPLKIQAQK